MENNAECGVRNAELSSLIPHSAFHQLHRHQAVECLLELRGGQAGQGGAGDADGLLVVAREDRGQRVRVDAQAEQAQPL